MTTLYLVRHGITEWNMDRGRYCGSSEISDIDLAPLGVKQAEALSERIKDKPFAAFYSSPMKRTLQTASILTRPLDLEVITEEGLRERSYGRWEGLTVSEINERFPGDYQLYEADPGSFSPLMGETGLEVETRVAEVAAKIASRHPGEHVVLVAHEAANRILLCRLLGLSVSDYRRKLVQSNASLTIVEYSEGRGRLLLYNDVCHLSNL